MDDERKLKQFRSIGANFKTRSEEDGPKVIEGYFAVCGVETELWKGAYEEIAPGAFDNTLGEDIKALIDHESMYVLGRNKSNTLTLRADSHGLWAKIIINEKDSDAMNLYARVERGDVDQCSFGFEIISEEADWREDGTVKWTITEVLLREVTVCTFPQYVETSIQARKSDVSQHHKRALEVRRKNLKERLKKWA